MLKTLVCLMLAGALQTTPVEAFKKEMGALQADTDKTINDTGSRLMSTSRAALIDGYGVVVIAGVALEPPNNPLFPSAVSKDAVLKNVRDHQSSLKEKVPALIKQKLATMDSIGPDESLTIVIQLENYNPGIITNLPRELIFSAKKSSPQAVAYKEL